MIKNVIDIEIIQFNYRLLRKSSDMIHNDLENDNGNYVVLHENCRLAL